MSYANFSAIKTAIDNGATYSGGYVVESGVAKLCKLDAGVWTLDESEGVPFYNAAHFGRVRDNIILLDPGEYQYAIAEDAETPIGQLALVAGKARVIDP